MYKNLFDSANVNLLISACSLKLQKFFLINNSEDNLLQPTFVNASLQIWIIDDNI